MELILAGPQADKWTDKQKAAQFLISIGQKGRDVCRAMVQSEILRAADKEKPERLFEEFTVSLKVTKLFREKCFIHVIRNRNKL